MEFFEINQLKLGCLAPDPSRPAIHFKDIVASTPERVDHPTTITTPQSIDSLAPFRDWKMLGNDRYNDCVAVVWANLRRLITSKLSGRENYPSMDQVMEFYGTQNEDLDFEQGMAIQTALQRLETHGGPDGVKAVGFAKVDLKNPEEVRLALAIFGAIWIGMKYDAQNREQFEYGQPWTPPGEQQDLLGSHSVLVGGYLPDDSLKIVTWGQIAVLDVSFVQKRILEAWVVVWPEHFGSRRFTKGINLDSFRSEYRRLTKRELRVPCNRLNSVLYIPEDDAFPRKNRWLRIMKLTATEDTSVDGEIKMSYNTQPHSSIAPVSREDASDAIPVMDNDDLYLIYTRGNREYVEIQRLYGPGYYDVDSQVAVRTKFKRLRIQSDNTTFTIDNGDLYVIRTSKTISGGVEVYFYGHESNFQVGELYKPGFCKTPQGRYLISGGDLYIIVQGQEYLEIICVKGNANYSAESAVHYVTGIPLAAVSEIFNVGFNGDFYMVRHRNTQTMAVEVVVATAKSNYKAVQEFVTIVTAEQSTTIYAKQWIL